MTATAPVPPDPGSGVRLRAAPAPARDALPSAPFRCVCGCSRCLAAKHHTCGFRCGAHPTREWPVAYLVAGGRLPVPEDGDDEC
jgi:hypothetical protein